VLRDNSGVDKGSVGVYLGIHKDYSGSSSLGFSKSQIKLVEHLSFPMELNGVGVDGIFQVFVPDECSKTRM
jgi:hypothetical protein